MQIRQFKFLLVTVFFLMACEERKQLKEMHDSTGEMNKTTQSMDKTMQEMNTTMKGMSQTMSGMNETMKGMNRTMVGMNGTMGEMSGTMNGMDGKMGTMSETMIGMNGTMGEMNGTMNGMDKKMGKMSSTMTGMNDTMGDMSGTMTGMNGTMKQMNKQLGGMDSKMGALVSRIDSMDGKMGNLVEQITSMDSKMGQLLGCIGSMDTKMGSLLSQITSMDLKMGSLVDKIDAMDGKMGNLVQQITGMNTTLLELGSDMKSMSGKLDGMSAKMGDLLGKMNEIYDVARPAMAMILRDQAMKAVDSNEGLPAKISAAAKYFMAFEYQVQNAKNEENEKKRLELANSAATEFFLEVKKHLPKGRPEEKTFSLTGASEEIEAYSVAMYRVNEIQEEMVAHSDSMKKMSMLSLIEEALKTGQVVAAGQTDYATVPDFVKTILVDRDLAIWLLKIRVNTLVKMTLGRVSPLVKSEASSFSWLVKPVVETIKGVAQTLTFVKWDLEATKEELSMLETINRYMKAAVEAKRILQDLGLNSEMGFFLSTGLKNMNLTVDEKADERRKELVASLAEYRRQILTKVDPSVEASAQAIQPTANTPDSAPSPSAVVPGVEAPSAKPQSNVVDAPLENTDAASETPTTEQKATENKTELTLPINETDVKVPEKAVVDDSMANTPLVEEVPDKPGDAK